MKKKKATGKGGTRKLKLKKESVKDLDVKGKASGVKGGRIPRSFVMCVPTGDTCPVC